MQVYNTEKIVFTWTVEGFRGLTNARCTEDGSSFIATTDTVPRLQMFLLPEDSTPGQVSMTLIMELSRLCDIVGEGGIILSHILSERPALQIEKYLEREGLPFDSTLQEDTSVYTPATEKVTEIVETPSEPQLSSSLQNISHNENSTNSSSFNIRDKGRSTHIV